MTIDYRDILIESINFDREATSGECILGIFSNSFNNNQMKDTSSVYLGQLFMRRYYTFFDSSGYQNGLTDKLIIGIGEKNRDARILSQHYDMNSDDYQWQK